MPCKARPCRGRASLVHSRHRLRYHRTQTGRGRASGSPRQIGARVQERTTELAQSNRNLQLELNERKRAETRLARTVEELTRSNADLQQFAYAASHDLQEPLRTIAVYSE